MKKIFFYTLMAISFMLSPNALAKLADWFDDLTCKQVCGTTFAYNKIIYAKHPKIDSLDVGHLFCAEDPIYESIDISSLAPDSYDYSYSYYFQKTNYRYLYCFDTRKDYQSSYSSSVTACPQYCGKNYTQIYSGTYHDNPIYVCVHYPLDCGLSCTQSWDIKRSLKNYNYFCLVAIQNVEQKKCSPNLLKTAIKNAQKAMPKNNSCSEICGKGFFYHKTKDNAKVRVCLKNSSQDTSSRAIRWKKWKGTFNGKKFICKEAPPLDKK